MILTTRSDSPALFAKHCRRNLFPLVLIALFLIECTESSSQLATQNFAFDTYKIPIGSAKDQSVLTGFFFDGDWADVAVINIEANNKRRFRIYSFDNNVWALKTETTLNTAVIFVDVANIDGRDRLLTYGQGRLNWFDADSKTERMLVEVSSNFNPPRKSEIPHVDITHDLNDDGLDDLVLPEVDGFSIFIQTSNGSFANPVKIGPHTDLSGIYGSDGYRYDPWSRSRVHKIDYDQDGRGDLVFWSEGHFDVHLQSADGLFDPLPKTFTTDVPFDSDNPYSLALGDMTGRVLHSITDMNGDDIGDLVVFSLSGRSVSKKKSRCEVHFGIPATDGGLTFAREIGITFRSEDRVLLEMDRCDFDLDGQLDLMFTSIKLDYLQGSLWKSLKGFMGDDIKLDLEFYRMKDDHFAKRPATTLRIALDGEPSHREPGSVNLEIVLRGAMHEKRKTQKDWPRAFNRTFLVGDVNGDGRSDVIVAPTPDGLDIYAGIPGPNLFAQQPQGLKIPIPNDGEFNWLVDLNKDGKQDILLHHPSTGRLEVHAKAALQPPRVTMLIAR